ncbi:hypothetical protein [Lactobacillus sp.]|uniref:hypothetical protein n=1 Tax=Lactobacillus sp. TaxID=1591 RepID=UPI0019B5B880|nr:hypothetical protein [Lactobacillus sp.]MBD5430798.1 hypothetical protein [Lactobacillus sp.]
MARFSDFSGNRTNLRAKAINQIKRVGAISEHLGALGDFLVTTWGGLLIAVAILGVGVVTIFLIVKAADVAILAQNIIPAIFMAVGIVLLALNAALTNPVQGSQIIVSAKFLRNRINSWGVKGKRHQEQWWRFLDDKNDIVETNYKNKYHYLAVYSIRGIVSPVTFDNDLEDAARADNSLLLNIESNTVVSTVVSVDQTTVKKKQLPLNATPAMRKKRDLQYSLTSNLPNNQQIKTINVIDAPSVTLLRERIKNLEAAYQKGLVIGYQRLHDEELQNSFKEIFGEGRT